MSKLSIFEWSGAKREVHFVGYNRDHTVCFIRDEQNARRAITLSLPEFFALRFRKNPIGKGGSPPIEIARAVLHVPACFSGEGEMAKYNDRKLNKVQSAAIVQDEFWKV